MKVTCRSLLMYILSAVLVIGYILILLRSLMPKTSWEYELYYIEHETARWAGISGFDYTLGTPLKMTPTDPNTNYRFDAGWETLPKRAAGPTPKRPPSTLTICRTGT